MQGQYTTEELKEKNIITSVKQFLQGYCVTKSGHTYNYFQQCQDGSWINYDCKTKY